MLSIIISVIFLGLGILGMIAWFNLFIAVMMGLIPFCIVFAGIIGIVAGISSIIDSRNAERDLSKK